MLSKVELINRLNHQKELLNIERAEESSSMQTQINEIGSSAAERKGLILSKMICTNFKIYFGGKYLYTFDKSNHSEIPNVKFSPGSWVNVLDSNSNEIMRAVVYNIKRTEINIVVDQFVDENDLQGLFKVEMCVDNITYKRLEAGLDDLIKMIDLKSKNLLPKILLLDPFSLDDYMGEPLEMYQESLRELNSSQQKAVAFSLSGSPLTLVHGPPGTGKTKTLTAMIYNLIKNDKRVLVCSGTNTAVDHLVKSLIDCGINAIRVGHPNRVNRDLSSALLEKKLDETESGKHIIKIKRELQSCLRAKYKRIGKGRYLDKSEFKDEKILIKKYRQEIRRLGKKCLNELLLEQGVFCSTATMTKGDELAELSFDYVVIDEAAQLIEPMSYLPLLKGCKYILAGDHKQLPAVVKSNKCLTEGLDISLFESLVNNYSDVVQVLDTQYRMHPEIVGFSSDYFYNGQLISSKELLGRNEELLNSSYFNLLKKAIFIDTIGADFEEECLGEKGSYLNRQEALAIFRLIKDYMHQGTQVDCIGVIAPYRSQVNHIKDLLDDFSGVEVSTVDSFQGREKDCIVISLTRSNEKKQIGFLKEFRRMNVAMTRAKFKLIIIGDSGTIGKNYFYQQMIQYFQDIEGYHSIWEFPDLM